MANDKLAELVKEMRDRARAIEAASGDPDLMRGELLGIVGQLRRDCDQLESLIKPEPKWKAGQRLVSPSGAIYELVCPNEHNDSKFRAWDNGYWNDVREVIRFSPSEYVPWPRVGDWVRYPRYNHVTRVHRVDGAWASGINGCCYRITDLEPASPPESHVEHDCTCQWTTTSNFEAHINVKNPQCLVHGTRTEQSSQFSGPHWEREPNDHDISTCLEDAKARDLDLKRAVEELQVKRLRG